MLKESLENNHMTPDPTKLRKLTASDISILTDVNSPLLFGGENDIRNLLDYIFVTSTPIKQLIKAKKDWEAHVLTMGAKISQEDLEAFMETMGEDLNDIKDAEVEVEPSENEGKT